eukprot:gnl/MRDRNA2_/MRDRNA2_78593_c0_seq1.p1 gnl/MRDRNA2_/MRDRNA2_78593_c0~~gnl/MRDRNA2_/MRDRNA2_78593_c0_seq1.p1  ORF type:complete len:879 (-),score=217.14 gnl/MRDRNA2_/MRDRNA2_78593_c0_seq1:349-2985(-)
MALNNSVAHDDAKTISSTSVQPMILVQQAHLDENETSIDIEALKEQTPHVDPSLYAAFGHVELAHGAADNFNDLGRNFPRDNANRVSTPEELIAAVNDYAYGTPGTTKMAYYAAMAASGGAFYFKRRRIVPAGFFGHYVSAGRHMLTGPGLHVLKDTRAHWLEDVPIDDENELVREFGTKTVLVVPENHIGGAFRVSGGRAVEGRAAENDGEFVLFGQGRHVLESNSYRQVVVSKLNKDTVRLGPVTILYIKEGLIGGAFERNTGIFRILNPGPPYLLHEKEYEGIELKKRTLAPFSIGPIHFITVKEGEMAGAYEKATGLYQLLPPGHTYQLHEKAYEDIELVKRSNLFRLGPYSFITVLKGHIAGVHMKRGGEFVLLPPGSTYQLNDDEFDTPSLVKRNKHVVKCGPLTFLTLQEGVLTGAYSTKDGRFEEFATAQDEEFILHERDYHGLTVVEKYSSEVQEFGPNKIVTIPEGFCGVFVREGQIEIKEPGFYKVPAEYIIRENIPLQIHSERFNKILLRTKDSVRIHLSSVAIWRVEDPLQAAKFPGTLEELRESLQEKAVSCFGMLLRNLSRAEMLPCRQDVSVDMLLTHGAEMNESQEEAAADELMRKAVENSKEALQTMEAQCLELLNAASVDGSWGLRVVSVKVDSLELGDESILHDLESIAQAQLATKRKQVEGRQQVAAAHIEREAAMQQAQAKADVEQHQAESESKVRLAQARAQNEIALMEATNAAKAQAEAQKIEFDMQREMAENQTAIEEMRLKQKQREAETEAASVLAMATANYERGIKEQEVASRMPPQELELKRLELIVEGMKHFGQAAWRHPDEMQSFMHQLKPFLRLGPMNAKQFQTLIHDAQMESLQLPGTPSTEADSN